MKQLRFALWSILVVVLLCAGSAQAAGNKIQVLLIDGESGGPFHNWQLTTPILKMELDEAGLFEVTVATAPLSRGDVSNFKPDIVKYQVVVSNLASPKWPLELRAAFEEYVRHGGGFVIIHAADNAFPDWPAYNEMAGIGGWRGRKENAGPLWYVKDGKVVSDPAPGPAGRHGVRLPFQITVYDPRHPIMKGLPAAWMHQNDELYGLMRGPGKNMTILATAHSDPNNRGTGNEEPMLLALSFGKGKIFHTTLGHDPVALSCIGFITTFQRGTEWVATGKVTQKIPANFPTANTVSYRPDIAEMDPEFRKGQANKPVVAPPAPPGK